MQIQNINPMGAVSVPLLGRDVDAGAVITVTKDQGAVLLDQPMNWATPGAANQPLDDSQPADEAAPADPPADTTTTDQEATA